MPDTKKILLIDDDPMVLDLIQAALAEKDLEVDFCINGAEGLYAYLRNHEGYSAVILDLIMPDVSGEVFLQVVEPLLKSNKLDLPPFVVVHTAVEDFTHLKKLSDYQCVHAVCTKPVSPEKLVRAIDQIHMSMHVS
jgi:CheY-like chemotaxis protein